MNNNSKTFVIIALAVAIVGLGIGFAAFSSTLNIESTATVTPDSGSFRVVFSNINNGIDENPVVPNSTTTTSGISTTNGTINNTTSPSLTNLSATFTEPGQKVEYDLFVYNAGAYVANLNSVSFKGIKYCAPGSGTTASYVSSACQSINVTVKVGNDTYSTTTQNITGHNLSVGGYEPVKVTIEYASNGARADGPFTVDFPDVSLYYVTKTGVNEEFTQPFTGTIYRTTSEKTKNGDSIVYVPATTETYEEPCYKHPNDDSVCMANLQMCQTLFRSNSPEECYFYGMETRTRTIAATGLTSYETDPSNINQDYYLKHEIVNNRIKSTYACLKYEENGVQKEACFRPGGPNYGTYDGISYTSVSDVSNLNPTGNIAILQSIQPYLESQGYTCTYKKNSSECVNGTMKISLNSLGTCKIKGCTAASATNNYCS